MVAALGVLSSATAVLAANVDLDPTIEASIRSVTQTVASQWGVNASASLVPDERIEVLSTGEVRFGTKAINRAVANTDDDTRNQFLNLLVGHEVWHIKQGVLYGDALRQASQSARRMYECQADLASFMRAADAAFAERRQRAPPLPSFREELQRFIKAVLMMVSVTGETTGSSHPTRRARLMAANLALWHAAASHANALFTDSETAKIAVTRFAAWSDFGEKEDLAGWSLRQCKKLTRFNNEGLFAMDFIHWKDDTALNDVTMKVTSLLTLPIKNKGDRTLHVEAMIVSGSLPEGVLDDEFEKFAFTDVRHLTADVPPGESRDLTTAYEVSMAQGRAVKIYGHPTNNDTFFSAELVGPAVVPRSCTDSDLVLLAPGTRELASALLLIAAAAPGRFESIRGRARTGPGFDLRVYDSQVAIPDASSTQIFEMSGRLPYLSATLISSKDEGLARRTYDKFQKSLSEICAAAGLVVNDTKGEDGFPTMSIRTLSARSAANVHLYRARDGDFTALLTVNSTE